MDRVNMAVLTERLNQVALGEGKEKGNQTNRIVRRIKELAELFEKKNADYGDSWRMSGLILYLILGPVCLDTPYKQMAYGVFTRMLDKVVRAANLIFCATERQVQDEKPSRTLEDLGVYAQMIADETAKQCEGAQV